MNILFMCVANSARSQIAEGLAKKIFGGAARIESAGSNPSHVNPLAVQVMQEVGVDLTGHFSKTCDDLDPGFLNDLTHVITLCAEEVCPILSSDAQKLHWPLPDPAGNSGDDAARLARFRQTRDTLEERLGAFAVQVGVRV